MLEGVSTQTFFGTQLSLEIWQQNGVTSKTFDWHH